MDVYTREPIAVVGMSAIMPDAADLAAFWANLTAGRYSIGDVPAGRWDPELFYDPDPAVPDKTYSRIGGWVRQFVWDPLGWRLPVPPAVGEQLDDGQKWAVAGARAALLDAGWPSWTVDPERVAVILGNAIGGEKHYDTNTRLSFPQFARSLSTAPSFAALDVAVRAAVIEETRRDFLAGFRPVTEDTMPGELSNVLAGRVASLFNLRGPNFTTDAACASALAGVASAVRGLQAGDYDAAVTGGVDRNMGASAFIKFCKIGALSATGTRPFDAGADGFVMGEGAALFVLKRLADAERDGDRIYALITGIAGSSDGKGKGITAPNPVGQRLAVERAWRDAGRDPHTATYVEAHGTSTAVGDAVELGVLDEVFLKAGAAPGSIALGSVKSNIGHLKAAAGAAGLAKTALSLHHRTLAPSLHFDRPNPGVDWAATPFRVNTTLREWPDPTGGIPRLAGVSAFGFGGTNFHVVLEEYVPGQHRPQGAARSFAAAVPTISTATTAVASSVTVTAPTSPPASTPTPTAPSSTAPARTAPLAAPPARITPPPANIAMVAGRDDAEVVKSLKALRAPAPPDAAKAAAPVRVAIAYTGKEDLAAKAAKAIQAFTAPAMWRALRSQGVFLGRGAPGKVAFLYTGQGSQYVNMLAQLRESEQIVADTFAEADAIMTPLLGRPLSSFVYGADTEALELRLLQTEITQPAVLTADLALTRLLASYGFTPDMVMGHSLGEYGALAAAGSLTFAAALEAVSARGHEMASLELEDNGAMAAVFGPIEEIELIVSRDPGYVVIANINSTKQAVIGGGTMDVTRAIAAFRAAGMTATRIPVSHAFHTRIVAPASEPLKAALRRLNIAPPQLPIVSNVTGRFYPADAGVETMLDLLGRQVASPVQFIAGLHTLYEAGARVFVEVGPKKALQGFADDVLGSAHEDVIALYTNHPKTGDQTSFTNALAGLYAAGLYPSSAEPQADTAPKPAELSTPRRSAATAQAAHLSTTAYAELGKVFAGAIEQGLRLFNGETPHAAVSGAAASPAELSAASEPVAVTGAALGLPGVERVFDDANVARILAGQQFIGSVPQAVRSAMVDRHITRLVKRATGDPTFESIDDEAEVIKLAGRNAPLDVVAEFGVDAERDAALDESTRLAVGAGFDALRDAGIPLVMHYRTTTLGTRLPDRWGLPESMRDDTGVVFASAFPAYDAFAADLEHYFTDRGRREQLAALLTVRDRIAETDPARKEADVQIARLRELLAAEPYRFNRRFLFRALSMGHSQFAEIIGARGPNTQVNAACASTTMALAVAEDWIRTGRCRRVIIVSADDATSDALLPWIGSGFLASGAAATDASVQDAALPFDRRRHGMIIGAGAAALVVESAEAARERGVQPICEVLSTVVANSAFHGTRLDVEHISQVMDQLLRQAESRGVQRDQIAAHTVFVSHETYTPARGGSAAAEINALRRAFGPRADEVVITNTKGFTGHAMGAGIEDVVAVKALETGIVPPVPNFKERDPELGDLNLSLGGAYPVRYALRLAAGFGSQIAMSLMRWTPMPDGRRRAPTELGYAYRIADPQAWRGWLSSVSGRAEARLEVVTRRLRVAEDVTVGAPAPVSTPEPDVVMAEPRIKYAVPQAPEPAAVPAPAAASARIEAPAPEPVSQGPGTDEVATAVVEIVSQTTGYPPELLEPDLDLEADLGVDTVKQAEVFAAVRQRFHLERDENLRLRDFPTLNHVIDWVKQRIGAPEQEPETVVIPITFVEPAAAEAATQGPDSDEVTTAVVEIVSQTTGYPPELLEPDLDLEADLGVDTVKQAEVFAAVRQRFHLERDENLRLRDFPTLNHVIDWVKQRQTAAAATEQPAQSNTAETADEPDVTVLRRVAHPVVRPALDLCKPTGVTLGAGSRVVVMPDSGGVAKQLVSRLEKEGCEVVLLSPTATGDVTGIDGTGPDVPGLDGSGSVQGVYWLAGLDDEGPVETMDLPAWRSALNLRVKQLYRLMRGLYEQSPFLVTGTRLGGRHGYDDAGAKAVMGGAITGFAKAYRRERPEALVKAVDFPRSRKTAWIADTLIEETLKDPGCVEVGHADAMRWTVGLTEEPRSGEGRPLCPESVVAVTGAAGGIVSAIVADLARHAPGTYHLLDLAECPEDGDADARLFGADREAFKLVVAERLKARGERPTPVLIEAELSRQERRNAARQAVDAVRAAGGTAHYHRVNLTDAAAVAATMSGIRELSGRVDVLVHAAGMEISHALPDKEPAEFDRVFDVKADGWFNLLRGAGELPIGTIVAFSSVAARFGNAGQTDYSAANDLLCKCVSGLRRTGPQIRALAVDWSAWAGIGMASRGSIPAVMKRAGIEQLPAQAAIDWLRAELTESGESGEVVAAGALGALAAQPDESGGVLPERFDTAQAGPMIGTVESFGTDGLTVRTTLDPMGQPFLNDHRIDGTPVLPGVMGIEAFAEIARLAAPDWLVADVEDVEFLAPLKFYRDEPREITVRALLRPDGPDLVAQCSLEADRTMPHAAGDEPVTVRTVHFTGKVRLTHRPERSEREGAPRRAESAVAVPAADIYRLYFHGPAYQVVASAWGQDGATAAALADGLPPDHEPQQSPTLAAPRLVELCFQTAGLIQAAQDGELALPRHVDRVRVWPAAEGPAFVRVQRSGEHFDASVLDAKGGVIVRLEGYRATPLPDPVPADVRDSLAGVV